MFLSERSYRQKYSDVIRAALRITGEGGGLDLPGDEPRKTAQWTNI